LLTPKIDVRPPPDFSSGTNTPTEAKADLPSSPNTRPSPISARDEQWTTFINKYDGGECFLLLPVTLNSPRPKIDGYGASVAPFEVFDNAFTKANKIEADIGVHQVTAEQCPAITFLRHMRSELSTGPKVELENLKLRAGEALRGTLQNLGSRHPVFLLVSETGAVHNLTNFLRPEGELHRFSIPLPKAGTPGEQPQLLVALATSQPLESINSATVLNAASFFPPLLAQLEQKHEQLGVAALYFKLDR
jgi:serine/threonine-protein kinase